MRYLIRVANTKKYIRHQVSEVSKEFQQASSVSGVSLKNFRVSDYAVEFDLFSDDVEAKASVLQAINSRIGAIQSERYLTKEETLRSKKLVVGEAVKLFNEQRYWECHEALESIWRIESTADEKSLQQGVILAASSLVHAQKGEDAVCFDMVGRALGKLESWRNEKYYDLNVHSLKSYLESLLETRRIFFRIL